MNEIIVNAVVPGTAEWWYGMIVLAVMAVGFIGFAPKHTSSVWPKWQKILGWIIFIHQVFGIATAVYEGTFTVQNSLPLHMCSFSQLLLFLHLVYDIKWAFVVVTFWGPLGGIQAFLTPGMANEINWFHLTEFYISHGFVVVVPLYLMIRGGRRLPRRVFWRVVAITTTIAVFMMGINTALGSNYMYVNQPPPVDHPLVQGEWPEYLLVFVVAVLVLFYLYRLALYRFMEPKAVDQ